MWAVVEIQGGVFNIYKMGYAMENYRKISSNLYFIMNTFFGISFYMVDGFQRGD